MRRVSSCLVVFLAVGCDVPVESARTGATESSITNGTVITGYPSVVALVRKGQKTAFCTGTAIATRVVLTAGHCVDAGLADTTQVFFGDDLANGGVFVDVIHAEQAPGFERSTLTHDVALLVLAADSPAPAFPISQKPFDPSFVGRTIRVVGFGSTGGMNNTFMLKREGIATIAEFEDKTFLFHPEPSQTCAGDSGGPAFSTFDGTEYLVGIARSGDPGCTMFARHTRVDPFVTSFIQPFIARSMEGAAEVGDPCYYTANCSSGMCMQAPDDARIHYCSRSCTTSFECPLGMACNDARCELPTPTPGALGSSCNADADCKDYACARFRADQPLECRRPCQNDEDLTCADGQYCSASVDNAEKFVCSLPVRDNGCAAGGSAGLGAALALLFVRRRRALRG